MGQVIYLGTPRTGRFVSAPPERVSHGREEFSPLLTQQEIDAQAADAARAALVRKIRPRFMIAALLCFVVGWEILGLYFAVFAIFTRSLVNLVKGNHP